MRPKECSLGYTPERCITLFGDKEFIVFLESIANVAAVDQVIERMQKAMRDPVAWSEPSTVALAIGQDFPGGREHQSNNRAK